MKKHTSKIMHFLIIVGLSLVALIVIWRVFSPIWNSSDTYLRIPSQSFDYPVYYNNQTKQHEKIEPMPEAEPVDETYIKTRVSERHSPVGTEIFLTPSNNSKQDWLIVEGDTDKKIKRLTVACSKLMGVSELASRGPIFIQVDIQINGEWVFGIKQPLNSYEVCQFILPQRSPFRCYLWKPEGSDWICEYSYTSRWW